MKMPEKRSKKRINEIHRNRIFSYLFIFLNQDDNTGSPKTTHKKKSRTKKNDFYCVDGATNRKKLAICGAKMKFSVCFCCCCCCRR